MHARPVRLLAPAALALALAGCTIELHHDLTEQDANEIYVLLTENGISASKAKEEGGNEPRYLISVPKADASQAAKLLREYSLPRPDPAGFKTIRMSKGMIPTEIEQRAMMLEAVGGEVSAALNRVDGVLEARTIVMIPEKNDLAQPDQKPMPSASVFIKYRDTTDGKPPLDEQNVRRFVASAVESLRPEAVTVIMTQATPSEALRDEGEHLVYVFGLQMAKGSAGSFKAMVAVVGLVMLALAALTTWTFLRTGSGGKPRRG
jgi:type III secretion protein J